MLDPVVHAALVTLAMFFVKWLFALLNINLGDDIAGQLAQFIVAYILSLFGYTVYARFAAKSKTSLIGNSTYHPPLT